MSLAFNDPRTGAVHERHKNRIAIAFLIKNDIVLEQSMAFTRKARLHPSQN